MNDCPDKKRHRRNALARARRCSTCKDARTEDSLATVDRACLGCGELIGYYSCAPGYCVACAHDPCWVSLSEAVNPPTRSSVRGVVVEAEGDDATVSAALALAGRLIGGAS